jgi:protein involved in polysaccharide export with SLBB domain
MKISRAGRWVLAWVTVVVLTFAACGLTGRAAEADAKPPGDTFKDRKARSEIVVTGEVGRPGTLVLTKGTRITVAEAIKRAGGFGRYAMKRRTRVTREDGLGQFKTFTLDLSKPENIDNNFTIEPGDVVMLPEVTS